MCLGWCLTLEMEGRVSIRSTLDGWRGVTAAAANLCEVKKNSVCHPCSEGKIGRIVLTCVGGRILWRVWMFVFLNHFGLWWMCGRRITLDGLVRGSSYADVRRLHFSLAPVMLQ